jgi:hypothetical protein
MSGDATDQPAAGGRVRAWLESARVANTPGVAAEVWFGFMLGGWCRSWGQVPEAAIPWAALAAAVGAGLTLYLAGNFLNDWHDRAWDARYRPERALPRLLFRPATYFATAVVCGAAGLAMAALAGVAVAGVAAAIVGLILVYTRIHKTQPAAVAVVAACRGLLVVAGFFAAFPQPGARALACVAIHALGPFAWTAGLALLARGEADPPAAGVPPATGAAGCWFGCPARLLLLVPFVAMPAWWMVGAPVLALAGLAPLAAWFALCERRFRHPRRRHVGALLAGPPLVDFAAAVPLAAAITGSTLAAPTPLAAAVVAVPAAAFALGLATQRSLRAT